jgi:Domain of unknown function (DUF4279)
VVKNKDNEAVYFAFGATLRITGDIASPEEISRVLGLQPTHLHRRGERRSARAAPYEHDMWAYEAPVAEEQPLSEHLRALRAAIGDQAGYLKELRESGLKVDIFCGYRSNSDSAGFEVEHDVLKIFIELETPLDVSVIIA